MKIHRRDAVRLIGSVAGGALAGRLASAQDAAANDLATIVIDPTPRYELSPYLYMQFMEPLGATDSSVEASWDHPPQSLAARFCGDDAPARARR